MTTAFEKDHKGFIPYLMAGDAPLETLETTIIRLQQLGATGIELGIPYSDPVADGEVIRLAGERALQRGVHLKEVLDTVEQFSTAIQIPIYLMGYINSFYAMGLERFAEKAQQAGIAGVIIPDCPLEEQPILRDAFDGKSIAIIPLVALTSGEDRIRQIMAQAEGFIYAVTVNGITGKRQGVADTTKAHLARLRTYTDLPIYAGFGISSHEDVVAMQEVVDGVIVGSVIVDALYRDDWETIEQLFNAPVAK